MWFGYEYIWVVSPLLHLTVKIHTFPRSEVMLSVKSFSKTIVIACNYDTSVALLDEQDVLRLGSPYPAILTEA